MFNGFEQKVNEEYEKEMYKEEALKKNLMNFKEIDQNGFIKNFNGHINVFYRTTTEFSKKWSY